MKRFMKSKKGLALLATMVVAAAGAIAGYAFFTTTGTGNGTASVGAAASFNVAVSAASGGPLYPDPTAGGTNLETVAYQVTNPSPGNQSLNNVIIAVSSGWSVSTADSPSCTAADFSIDGQAVGNSGTDTYTTDMAPGAVTGGAATIEMIDNGSNQDNCENASVPLTFSASS